MPSTPQDPTAERVRERLREWDETEKYVLHERCLNLLYQRLLPGNDNLGHILIKVSTLNDFYSTNIFDTNAVAKHILDLDVASNLQAGDLEVVNRIAPVEVGGKIRRFYSFATKYCSHHFPEKYPIYDRYVEKVLLHFRKRDKFASFKNAELKDYPTFVAIIREFSEAYSLSDFTVKQIDMYLWLTGKEYYSPY